MSVTIQFAKNTGPNFHPDSKVYGPYARAAVEYFHVAGTVRTCLVAYNKHAQLLQHTVLAWKDGKNWYCDMDGDVYGDAIIRVHAE